MAKIIFKPVTSNQIVLFPENIGDRIPKNHPVRLVNQVIDKINMDGVFSGYKGGGTSSFHPRVMIKILFYSYFNNIYSARKIEKALHENIYFMWISGNSQPNFRTINLFRSKRLKNQINNLFIEIVRLIAEMGYVSLNKQFIDGTKIESASNKYTFVWRGSTEKYKEKLEEKIKSVLSDIDSAIKEDASENNPELKEINSEELQSKIEQLNQNIDKLNKKQQKNLNQLKNEHLPRLQKYENQLDTLGDRNSFSKTDTDATFMRMKDDHMRNGQLKPAYNTQISTENQFVTNFSVHQRPGDTATLIAHLEQFNDFFGKQSEQVIADAGYGSEENYEYMHNNDIEAFVKYNYFHKEQKRKFKNDIFHPQNLFYNAEKDYFVCPMGQHMEKVGTGTRRSDLGYVSHVTYYQAKRCEGCPLRWGCHKSKNARIIEINHKLREYKRLAQERLLSEEGVRLRGQRCIEPEAVFGQLKSNNLFNRFKLRGLGKVNIEFGLAVIAHNLRKLARLNSEGSQRTIFKQLFALFALICMNIKFTKQNRRKFKPIFLNSWKNDPQNSFGLKNAA
jgi:transposase